MQSDCAVLDTVDLEAVGGGWRRGADGVCRLRFPAGFDFEPDSRDWVGLFQADKVPHLKAFVTWYWVSSAVEEAEEEPAGSTTTTTTTKVRFLTFQSKYLKSLNENLSSTEDPSQGPHQLVYISGDYDNVYGVSSVFNIEA